MALDASTLANKLHNTLSQKTDANGAPTKVSACTQAYAKGIVAALKAAVVSNLPGTINGVTAPGSDLALGSANAGVMVMTPAPMLSETLSAFPPGSSANIAAENAAVIQYIGTGLISFTPGKITGTCTNSPVSPGPLTLGKGQDGKITLLTGAGALAAVIAATGPLGPEALNHYNTLINYILESATVSYAIGSVNGVCPPGGGPLGGGFAAGGTVS